MTSYTERIGISDFILQVRKLRLGTVMWRYCHLARNQKNSLWNSRMVVSAEISSQYSLLTLTQGFSQQGWSPLYIKFLRHQVGPSSRKHLLTGAHSSALPMPLVVSGKLATSLKREKQRGTFMARRENVKVLSHVGEQGKVRERLGAGYLERPPNSLTV